MLNTEIMRTVNNASLNGEDIYLNSGKTYFVIDGLYLQKIGQKIDSLKKDNLEKEMREKVFPFPYTDIPFTKYVAINDDFSVKSIRKIYYEQINDQQKGDYFSSDSGLILFIEEKLLPDFVKYFNYDELVNSITDVINIEYWNSLIEKYGDNIGLIIAPGIDSGYEFEGSGTYKIA